MQIQIMKPNKEGKHFPNYDTMIEHARDNEERDYLISVKHRKEEWAAKGYPDEGFAFGIVYTSKMACGHYELLQHPIFREYGKEPTEENIMESVEDIFECVRIFKAEHRKCTRCICGWR